MPSLVHALESPGIHHVTAIVDDPRENLDFYARVLGLRLVKRTVNYDDPSTWHFYLGDEEGSPGSLFTFFVWPGSQRGRQGAGQASVVSFAIHPGSVGFWMERLIAERIEFEHPKTRFGDERVISVRAPDGLLCELVAHQSAESRRGRATDRIPAEHSIRGLYSVTLWEKECEGTRGVLVDVLGFELIREQGAVSRFAAKGRGMGSIVDLRCVPGLWDGASGAGTVHHVAFRAFSSESQLAMRGETARMGLSPTPQIDRTYFQSVYFREPGGVLLEIATDAPGLTVDEPADSLGATLALPSWLESRRPEIAARLPDVGWPDD